MICGWRLKRRDVKSGVEEVEFGDVRREDVRRMKRVGVG